MNVYQLSGLQTSLIYTLVLNFEINPLYPLAMHADNGFFAVIFQGYDQGTAKIVVKVYQNTGEVLNLVRTYEKEGYYV